MNKNSRILLMVLAVLLIAGGIWWFVGRDEGLAPISPPTPTPGGTTTTLSDNLVRVTAPSINATISSPLLIEGEARGYWFFEASFPVRLLDATGKEIANGIAEAQREWMTEDFVPFRAVLAFQTPATETGTLVLHKDNPSGLPEHDDERRIPVRFEMTPKPIALGGCVVSGCSSEVCSDKEMVSACVYKPEFACYKNATCERQQNGQCGWTETTALTECVAQATVVDDAIPMK